MNKDNVKSWRKRWKRRIVVSFGGGCQCCNYNRCDGALEVVRIDKPTIPKIGALRANIRAAKSIIDELSRSALICTNCHREIADGLRSLPIESWFNEDQFRQLIEKPQPRSHSRFGSHALVV